MINNNLSIKEYNTFGVEAKCNLFFSYDSEKQIIDFLKKEKEIVANNSILVLGEGSNTLFVNDFDGLIIHPNNRNFEINSQDANYFFITAGAGVHFDDLVAFCVENNIYGIENLSHIPGSVGASAVQNIGAYGVEAKDIIFSVKTIDAKTAKISVHNNEECEFAYRDSIFKQKLQDKIILSVTYRLNKQPAFKLNYKGLHEELAKAATEPYTIVDVRNAIINIRTAKLPDYKTIGNAGSFFTNPVISKEHHKKLANQYPNIPCYETDDNKCKIPAAFLIEQCGWKGKQINAVGVFEKQPLVIINLGGATGKDIMDFAETIKQNVADVFNIELNTEVKIII